MLLHIISMLTTFQSGASTDDVMLHVEGTGFAFRRVLQGRLPEIQYERTTDKADLAASILSIPDRHEEAFRGMTETNVRIATQTNATFTSWPCGDRVISSAPESGPRMICMLGNTYVEASIRYMYRTKPPNLTFRNENMAADKVLLEGLCRNALAKSVGRSLVPSANASSGGTTFANVFRTLSGVAMVPLRQWAAARDIVLTENERLGTFSFVSSGRQFVVPLASKSVKRGSTWHSLDAPILKRTDAAYIPLTNFDSLR